MKRAALLVFHQDPENWLPGAYIKIGMFENAADILYQDEIHGPLITMADKVEDLVYTKYFKGTISYEGLQRIETFPVPRLAFREAVLNAIQHRDYSTGNPIHIHIYPDEVLIYNDGCLPESWTVDDLFSKHSSKPYNPLIAGAFFRTGQIEAWGRGVEKITDNCRAWGKSAPFYRIRSNEVMIGFSTDVGIVENIVDGIVENIVEKNELSEIQVQIIQLMRGNPKISASAISKQIGIAPRNVQVHIQALKTLGLVERTGPAKGGHWAVKLSK
jgi:ATP-dependent DNA helicase RecG